MQVALATVGGTAGRARRAADDLVAAGMADLGVAGVVVLGERPAAAVPAIVRACDLLVLLVAGAVAGGPGGPDIDAADAVVASAVAARHVAVLAVSDGPLDEATDRWLTRLAIEHPVARGHDLAPLVAGALAERRRCLLNPVTEPGPHDLANEPREGRTLDEVALGDPQPRPPPSGDAVAGGLDRAGADEQWNEAVQAWRARLWGPMVEHLQRALDRRPLDADAGLWLARVLAASLSVGGRAEAVRRATYAARLAEQKGRVHWAAAAWLWVARLDRTVDPAAALDAAGRAAVLVPHRAEPWVERALVHVWTGDDERARQAALVAYRHHERSLHDLLGDTCSPPDPVEVVALEDHVRQASLDRLVQLLQLAIRLGAQIDGPIAAAAAQPAPPGWLAPPSPIGAEASDELAAMSLDESAEEGRRLSGAVHARLRQWAAALAEEGRKLQSPDGAGPSGPRAEDPADAGGWGRAGSPGRNAIHDRDSLVWGLAGAGAIAACGVGLWWATGWALWMLLALGLALAAAAWTLRAATDPAAAAPAAGDVTPAPTAPADTAPAPAAASPPAAPTAVWPAPSDGAGAPAPVDSAPTGTWPPGSPPAPSAAVTPEAGQVPGHEPLDEWRMRVQGLGAAIERAESLTLDWPRLGPAVPAYRARTGDLVALGSAAQFAGGTVPPGEDGADEWLPADLRQLAGPFPVSEPPPVAGLYRLLPAAPHTGADAGRGSSVVSDRTVLRAVRWAAYFDPAPSSAAG